MLYTYPLGVIISLPGISFLGKKVYNYIAGDRLTVRCTEANCTMPVFTYPTPETQDVLVKGWNKLAITKLFWKLLLAFVVLAQVMFIWFSPYVQSVLPIKDKLNRMVGIPYNSSKFFLTKFLGITSHPVFMYNIHFKNYNHIFKIEYSDGSKKGIVPILDENGMIGNNSYAKGALWVNYTFRVCYKDLDIKKYEKGIVPYLKYFESNTNKKNLKFTFYVKEITTQEEWEKDFLSNQMKKPWVKVGTCTFHGNHESFEWNEKMIEIQKGESAE